MKINLKKRIFGASMFSGGGIGETYLKKCGIDIVAANEIDEKRAKFYSEMYSDVKMIQGDIRDKDIKKKFMDNISKNVKFLLATPPCQGMSNIGKNKSMDDMVKDKRNYLIFEVFDVIDKKNFDFILIENVPKLFKIELPYKGKGTRLIDILNDKYGKDYIIEAQVLNAKDYQVPQTRPRAIVKMYKKKLSWKWPEKYPIITLREAIGDLPSIESNESSNIKFHYARKHDSRQVLWLKHTATGHSAYENKKYYPQKLDGTKIKGYKSTYKRMKWDAPAPAVTMRSDCISSQENVHPGKKLSNGLYSDARVLSLLEIFRVFSLPDDWDIPIWASDTFIRQIIGEGVPPKFMYNIVKGIDK